MDNGINSIVVFGDSLLRGTITGDGVNHLFAKTDNDSLTLAQKELGFSLVNHSVFGSTITKGQKRIQKFLDDKNTADLAVIEFCGNDCDRDWNAVNANPDAYTEVRTPIEPFMEILDSLVSSLRTHKITPLLFLPPPIISQKYIEHISIGHSRENILKFLHYDSDFLYRIHELYTRKIELYAIKNNVQYADMRSPFLKIREYSDFICKDGIHPNEAGYRLMADEWIKLLPSLKKEF